MIDHEGSEVVVGWADHEIVWLEAALTLPKNERAAAFQDIAELTGRTFCAVRSKSYWMNERKRLARLRMDVERNRKPMAIITWSPGSGRRPKLPPSELAPLSKARLMGARA
jgi:hypothetical protein